MPASWDMSATIAQQAASLAAQERARSAKSDRLAAADARRQFRLDRADDARVDQPVRMARSHVGSHAHTGSVDRPREADSHLRVPADRARVDALRDRRAAGTERSRAESQGRSQAATSSEANERVVAKEPQAGEHTPSRSEPRRQSLDASAGPHPRTARPDASGPQSASSGDPLKQLTGTTPAAISGRETATEDVEDSEADTSDEPGSAAETQSGVVAIAEPPVPSVPKPQPAGSAPADAMSDAGDTERPAVDVLAPPSRVGQEPTAAGEIFLDANAPHAIERSQDASDGAGTGFATLLDAADPKPTRDTSATFTEPAAASRSATGAEGASRPPSVPLGGVPMTIALHALRDTSRFEIRLDPVELGRIDVQLDIDRDAGTVSADLVVDRPTTLALLQRDASVLQQALSQAGLDASTGISLSLRDGASGQGRDGAGAHGHSGQGNAGRNARRDTPSDIIDPVPLRALRLSGLDIRI